ncbi:hypothetical protein Hypma_013131 [Hypsizygus marmoreus]|uniref:Transmembrane protein n=1 Tax=Hypsizygus marmoreus TaxID=39966 RepID=A0A369JHG0_HYPMA|nr:hypothetical protein Hypma_013131 [Hypsizygus marmoreus]
MFLHHVLLVTILCFALVQGLHNVTVDDPDPSIIYTPATSWSQSANNSLNAGGAHKLTQDPTATATFTFTGVAIYFLSPLWPYTVNTAVSLDAGPSVLIDLVDHSRPDVGAGPETVQSQAIWSAVGLPNAAHKLVISVGAGQPFAIVDTLIYTALDPSDTASSTTSASSATTITQTSTTTSRTSTTTSPSASASSSSEDSSSTPVLPIALGTVLGVLGLLIIAFAIFFCNRRRKRPISEAWTVAGHPYPGSPQMTTSAVPTSPIGSNGGNYPSALDYSQSGSSWSSPRNSYTSLSPIPGAMAPATAAALASSQANRSDGGEWQGTTSQIAQQYMRSPNRYQSNTLSTITETSTPPLGARSPLAHSPSSHQTELSQGNGSAPSLPSETRVNSSSHPGYMGGNQESFTDPHDSTSSGRPANRVNRVQPPAYTR